MATSVYGAGDFIYVEGDKQPYFISRIEGFQYIDGNAKPLAKIMIFYRRFNLPEIVHNAAQQYERQLRIKAADKNVTMINTGDQPAIDTNKEWENFTKQPYVSLEATKSLSDIEKFAVAQRELVGYREIITVPLSLLRGKCYVMANHFIRDWRSFLRDNDLFYAAMIYDPKMKIVFPLIRGVPVSVNHQAIIPDLMKMKNRNQKIDATDDELKWSVAANVDDQVLDQFLLTVSSIGSVGRILEIKKNGNLKFDKRTLKKLFQEQTEPVDLSDKHPRRNSRASQIQQILRPEFLNLIINNSCRDKTKFHAMDVLHENDYSIIKSLSSFCPSDGPLLCRDALETWTGFEKQLFIEGLLEYGKDFKKIQMYYLPMKTLAGIIEFYYQMKTTPISKEILEMKAKKTENSEANRIKFQRPHLSRFECSDICIVNERCGVCNASKSESWHLQIQQKAQWSLCHYCWLFWNKYAYHRNSFSKYTITPRRDLYFHASVEMKVIRFICRDIINLKKLTRKPYTNFDQLTIKKTLYERVHFKSYDEINKIVYEGKKKRSKLDDGPPLAACNRMVMPTNKRIARRPRAVQPAKRRPRIPKAAPKPPPKRRVLKQIKPLSPSEMESFPDHSSQSSNFEPNVSLTVSISNDLPIEYILQPANLAAERAVSLEAQQALNLPVYASGHPPGHPSTYPITPPSAKTKQRIPTMQNQPLQVQYSPPLQPLLPPELTALPLSPLSPPPDEWLTNHKTNEFEFKVPAPVALPISRVYRNRPTDTFLAESKTETIPPAAPVVKRRAGRPRKTAQTGESPKTSGAPRAGGKKILS